MFEQFSTELIIFGQENIDLFIRGTTRRKKQSQLDRAC